MEGSGRRWSIKQDYCRKARSATKGFISVANNLRGFGLSLYSGIDKVLQLYKDEEISEESLMVLGFLGQSTFFNLIWALAGYQR
ncbi:MAG: hypothetical protein CSA25_00925 [Desulfobacter postgatei]|uniref:Uncharacterized protein n=1 Tax=Desulfobacter postgatei TaxID=2293 RepID=A0A2G6MTF2_9BACT|nr:MAG: hypothetical protein CSA25_00925 [Desulfobacter postgatei]